MDNTVESSNQAARKCKTFKQECMNILFSYYFVEKMPPKVDIKMSAVCIRNYLKKVSYKKHIKLFYKNRHIGCINSLFVYAKNSMAKIFCFIMIHNL